MWTGGFAVQQHTTTNKTQAPTGPPTHPRPTLAGPGAPSSWPFLADARAWCAHTHPNAAAAFTHDGLTPEASLRQCVRAAEAFCAAHRRMDRHCLLAYAQHQQAVRLHTAGDPYVAL
jgi:hypothetical protein